MAILIYHALLPALLLPALRLRTLGRAPRGLSPCLRVRFLLRHEPGSREGPKHQVGGFKGDHQLADPKVQITQWDNIGPKASKGHEVDRS